MHRLSAVFWSFVTLWGTLGAGLLICGLGLALDLTLGLCLLMDLALITAVANTIKYFHFKPRPDNPEALQPPLEFHPLDVRKYLSFPGGLRNFMRAFAHIDAGSFPSIHSARSLNQALLLAWFFKDAPASGAAMVAFALLVGWSRWVKRRHWRFDIFVGFVLGALVAALTTPFLVR